MIGDFATRPDKPVGTRWGEVSKGELGAVTKVMAGDEVGVANDGSGLGDGEDRSGSLDDNGVFGVGDICTDGSDDGVNCGSILGVVCSVGGVIGMTNVGGGSSGNGDEGRVCGDWSGGSDGDCGGGLIGQSRPNQVPGMSAIGSNQVALRMTPYPWS